MNGLSSVGNINGIGKVSFPRDGGFGSGDIPLSKDDELMLRFKRQSSKYKKDGPFKHIMKYREFEPDMNEASIMDRMNNKSIQKSDARRLSGFMQNERARHAKWFKKRKFRHVEQIKKFNTQLSELEYARIDALDKFKFEAKENKPASRKKEDREKYNSWLEKHLEKKDVTIDKFDSKEEALKDKITIANSKFEKDVKEKRIEMGNRIRKYRKN